MFINIHVIKDNIGGDRYADKQWRDFSIRAAYRSGVINFETYEEIKKKVWILRLGGPGFHKPGSLQGDR